MPDQPYFNIGKVLHVWIERFLFIWLPIYALFRLTSEVIKKFDEKK